MICPVCQTHNQDTAGCAQCGSDLDVHRLLQRAREAMQMKNETTGLVNPLQKTTSRLLTMVQILPSAVLLIVTLFSLFVGLRCLTFLDQAEAHRVSVSNQWANTGYQQLQEMDVIIKQELGFILAQHRENVALQAQVRTLTAQLSQNTGLPPVPSAAVFAEQGVAQ